ncbi:hypothetical protein C8J57DRAFT_1347966 [Mycena rebaudengoi]|nr:hypothetical protein C8J57DRAFT_1347966 [Mycena rebaudengoi]
MPAQSPALSTRVSPPLAFCPARCERPIHWASRRRRQDTANTTPRSVDVYLLLRGGTGSARYERARRALRCARAATSALRTHHGLGEQINACAAPLKTHLRCAWIAFGDPACAQNGTGPEAGACRYRWECGDQVWGRTRRWEWSALTCRDSGRRGCVEESAPDILHYVGWGVAVAGAGGGTGSVEADEVTVLLCERRRVGPVLIFLFLLYIHILAAFATY